MATSRVYLTVAIVSFFSSIISVAASVPAEEIKASGTAVAYQQKANDSTLAITISGPPAEMMYNQFRYGKTYPQTVPLKAPEPIEKENIRCMWRWIDQPKVKGEFICAFTVNKEGLVRLPGRDAKKP